MSGAKVRIYESCEADVRYVYGYPVRFPLASKFTDDEKLGSACQQAKDARDRHAEDRFAFIQRAMDREMAAEARASEPAK